MLPSVVERALEARAGVRLLVSGPGGLLAVADLEGGISMLADRQPLWRLPAVDLDPKTRDAARVTDMVFDQFGEQLLVSGSHGVAAFEATSGKRVWTRKRRWVFGFLADLPLTVCRGPETDVVVSWSSGRVERLDRLGAKKRSWSDNNAPESMVYLPVQQLLVGADGYSLRTWDATVWPPVERASVIGRWVKVVSVPGGELVLARRLDSTILFRAADLEVVWAVPGPVSHPSIAASADKETFAWLDDREVSIHSAFDGAEVSRHRFDSRPLCVAADDAGYVVGLADGRVIALEV